MSWDADLYTKDADGNEIHLREWNYTHNMNPAINAALGSPKVSQYWAKQFGGCWWELFDGKTTKETAPLFTQIITEFEVNPGRYEAMEPDNKWGSLKTLLPILKEMLEMAKTHPSATWAIRG